MWTDFSIVFHQLIRKKILTTRFPPHLQCIAILSCEIRKSKNVTDFDNIRNKV